jgi:hypothetical protein
MAQSLAALDTQSSVQAFRIWSESIARSCWPGSLEPAPNLPCSQPGGVQRAPQTGLVWPAIHLMIIPSASAWFPQSPFACVAVVNAGSHRLLQARVFHNPVFCRTENAISWPTGLQRRNGLY